MIDVTFTSRTPSQYFIDAIYIDYGVNEIECDVVLPSIALSKDPEANKLIKKLAVQLAMTLKFWYTEALNTDEIIRELTQEKRLYDNGRIKAGICRNLPGLRTNSGFPP